VGVCGKLVKAWRHREKKHCSPLTHSARASTFDGSHRIVCVGGAREVQGRLAVEATESFEKALTEVERAVYCLRLSPKATLKL